MSNFPTSLDSYSDPTATSKLNSPDHAQQHIGVNDAIEKIEAKVGIDASAVTSSHDYKLSGVGTGDKAVSKTGVETLTNKVLTTPVITSLYQDTEKLKLITLPAATDTLIGKDTTDTLTNKTLTAPVLTKPTINGSVQGIATHSPAGVGTTTFDLSAANVMLFTMPEATQTLAVSNGTVGQYFVVELINTTSQGALDWFDTISWTGGTEPTLTGTNGKKDVFMFRITGSNTYDGYIVGMNI